MTMVLAALVLFGALGYFGLSLNMLPDANVPFVTIQTVYPGASPDQISSQITKRLEDEVSTVSEIKGITSYSLDSASVILIEFELSKDPNVATQEVKDKVDLVINDLPDGADEPIVQKIDITALPIVNIVMGGDIDAVEMSRLAETVVKDELSRIAGVGSVELTGTRDREIRVEFDNRVVYENAISLAQVAGILARANLDMPGGNMQSQEMDFGVRLEGQFTTVGELANLDIPTAMGTKRLGNIATIRDGGSDVRQRTTFFNNTTKIRDENTVRIGIIKSPDGNTVEVAREVIKRLPAIEAQLPQGVELTVTSDDSIEVADTVNDTITNIALGMALTALVLLFFLHDFRSTLIVALSMPISVIPTFAAMQQLGMSLNLMSLMGLSTSVGVLIQNSVVVLENIFRHKEMGHDRRTAAAAGTSEVVTAVLASTLTNIAVFLPMATMSGIAGLFLVEFAISISAATIFSMLISFTLTPMLASRILPEGNGKKHPIGDALERGFHSMEEGYRFLLTKLLHSKLRSGALILATITAFIATMLAFGRIPFEFMPSQDLGKVNIAIEAAQGTDLDTTAALLEEIERRVTAFDEVELLTTSIGTSGGISSGTNLASVDLTLIDKTMRVSDTEVAALIGEELATIPGARIKVSPVQSSFGVSNAAITFYLEGPDATQLANYARELRPRLSEVPGLINVDISTKPGKPEIVIAPDRIKLNDVGLTVQDLAITMRAAVEGMVTTTFKEAGEEYDIRVTLSDGDLHQTSDIAEIIVPTRAGLFPLGNFAEITTTQSVNQLLRSDKTLAIEVTADLSPGYIQGEMNSPIEATVAALGMPEGYRLSWGGTAELLTETTQEFLLVFIIAIVLTYMLLAALLERFGQPLLILSTIPLSLIGVVIAFLITGKTMNMVSMLAIVMLVGLVVNNAILILDYANQLRAKGMGPRQALIEAAPTKLKPILMSNIATMLGMLPMAMGIGASGAEVRQPMGIVSIGGLLAATFLSLFVIPAIENVVESKKKGSANA